MGSLNTTDYVIMQETPELFSKKTVRAFMNQEIRRPSKQWISSIIDGTQEREQVILQTDDYILLPDTERVNRYYRPQARGDMTAYRRQSSNNRWVLNWLAIASDKNLHTMRDLRGKHTQMLRDILTDGTKIIEQRTGIPQAQVMAYVHYPPSVYQLHVHFAFPYGQHCHRDTYRVHSVQTIINNLEIDPEYYTKTTIPIAIYKQSLHYIALTTPDSDTE